MPREMHGSAAQDVPDTDHALGWTEMASGHGGRPPKSVSMNVVFVKVAGLFLSTRDFDWGSERWIN